MKYKNYLIPLLLILTPNILKSQIFDNYGLKISYTRSKINVKEFDNYSTWRTGIKWSFFLEQHIYKSISTIIELEYAQKGYISEQVETNEIGEKIQIVRANTRLDYISVPIFMKISYNISTIKPFVLFGPRLDYMFSYKKGIFKFTKASVNDETAKYLDSVTVGSSLACGLIFPFLSKKNIIFEARYNNDFTDLWSKHNTWLVKNVSYDFGIGISL